MSKKSNSKFSLAIILSILFHVLLIIFLCYKAIQDDSDNYGTVNGQSIDAIMVDPSIISEQYKRQSQSQKNQQQLRQQVDEQITKQNQLLQQKQLEQQQYLKDLEKERLKLAEKLKQEQLEAEKKAAQEKLEAEKRAAEEKAAREKQEAEKRAAEEKAAREKQEAEKRAAEEKAAREKLEAEKRAAAEKAAREKQEAEKKAAEEKAAREKKEAAKRAAQQKAANDKAVNDLLGELTTGGSSAPATRKGVSNGELDKYKFLVKTAISNKFINPNRLYVGQRCQLQIQIAPDGLLLDHKVLSGDDALCREAVAATLLAVIPEPSQILYPEVKKMIINFEP
ncbi:MULTISPECIES: cell envelope integrity protein TolA [unclassified Gilliamella]|uniref:cell envelope integrity protein TolA n=1 Tax=unclassified Gilliamella TaxID=2685620 RepID=UPI002269A64B|nr:MULTISPECIES: cell envelope integrity protein TolA [unclassified Gilliamella]MCX8574100.1 cell envelope integrity protein TolA [Gilliamella sp. B3831]MCX8576331.1 cell envelope integrity protein TolA [Gilliamella sp. B3815]MCX8587525.1 cell envelope integrity protein TolA [Gilliamella sp. B3801]MCX8591180.1 cell envelope integrity protein TolA [Gilliamella sp. B3804]MCX8603432.1 cell envelope integrity protein TolA [Gilliamella sp. B3823]